MNKRRLIKTFTWQAIAVSTSMTIQYFIYHNISLSVVNTAIGTPVIMILFYLHEKLWKS